MPLSYVRVGPHDRNLLDAVFALRTHAAVVDTPHLPSPCRADFEGSLAVPPPATEVEEWLVCSGEGPSHPVASLRLEIPEQEDTSTVSAPHLAVRPDLRRMGIGRQVTEFAWARARLRDRSRVLFSAEDRTGAGLLPAHHLARVIGARPEVPLDHLRLDVTVAAAPAPVPEGCAIRLWGNAVPDDLVAEAARLEAALSSGATTEDTFGREPGPAAVTRIRHFERMRTARGIRAYQAGIRHEHTGRLLAWSAVFMTTANPDNALQAVTVVDREHRRLGFGRLVRLHSLASARSCESQLRTVDTWNTSCNVFIRRLDEQLGFRAVGTRYVWELVV